MSIIKDRSFKTSMEDYQDYDVYCDCVGCDVETRYENVFSFTDVVESMKNEGWKITKENGEWFHICQECKNKESKC